MRIVIDFDYTLFDTGALKRALAQSLERFGVTEEQYKEQEKAVKALGMYIPADHIERLVPELEREEASKAFTEVLKNSKEFVYPDAVAFLKEYEPLHITLLSFGSAEWQRRKIEASGLGMLVDDVIATEEDKAIALQKLANDGLIVINDRGSEINAMRAARPDAKYIWIRREGTPYHDEPCEGYTMEATDLSVDIHPLIETL